MSGKYAEDLRGFIDGLPKTAEYAQVVSQLNGCDAMLRSIEHPADSPLSAINQPIIGGDTAAPKVIDQDGNRHDNREPEKEQRHFFGGHKKAA